MTTQTLDSESMLNLAWRRFKCHKIALLSAMVLIFMAFASFGAPLFEIILGVDANLVNLYERFAGSSLKHPLGTDELGRDVLVRLLYGGQVSIAIGLTAALAAAVFGTLIGLIAGYYGGRFDAFLMRTTDAVIALPLLPLLIVLAALDLHKLGLSTEFIESENISLYRIIVIVALVGWTTVARLVRGRTLTVRERDFVLAARSQGASATRIMLVHILPNVVSPIIVATTLSIGNVILLESVLSFFGLGIQPPIASWGNLLTNAQELIWQAPSLVIYPGLAIFLTVMSFNFLGDGLQDALDPQAMEQSD